MFDLKVNSYLKLVLSVSIISLISAYFIEYFLGYQPCNLCLIERIPYWLSIILIIGSYIVKSNQKLLIILLATIFAFSLIVSIYHFGIEQGFFQESSICKIEKIGEIISKEEILKQLQSKKISCKDVTFRIFGFSLTTLTIVSNVLLLFLSSKILLNYEKFKK